MTFSVAPESQKDEFLFDFLYLDRSRLASYLAQLFTDGAHTHTKKSSATGAQTNSSTSGGIPGVIKAAVGGFETVNETIERQFDASWTAPLDLLRELSEQGYVSPFSADAILGEVVLFKGNIQVVDLRILQKLWQPMLALQAINQPAHTEAQRKTKKASEAMAGAIARVAEALPHIIQLRAFNADDQLWATLQPEALTVNASDLAFKYGPAIPGEWCVLALLDARPSDSDDIKLPQGLGDVESGMLQMALQLKTFLGRSYLDYGVTPLAIYRQVPKRAMQ